MAKRIKKVRSLKGLQIPNRSRQQPVAKRRYQWRKKDVTDFIVRNLNEIYFEGQLGEIDFAWLSPVSFRKASRSWDGTIHLHPALFDPQWKILLEFEIYRHMLRFLSWRQPQGINSLEFRRAEARIGNLHQRLELRRNFLLKLFKQHAKKLKLVIPKSASLLLYVCKRCGSGAARLTEDITHCDYCRLSKAAVMKSWDELKIMQHYKYSPSPADYVISELSEQRVFLFEDSFLWHFVS
ncbi:hypothetical protein ACFL54_02835 [Planctomycetota bacterium]